jgi:hypothetical protein
MTTRPNIAPADADSKATTRFESCLAVDGGGVGFVAHDRGELLAQTRKWVIDRARLSLPEYLANLRTIHAIAADEPCLIDGASCFFWWHYAGPTAH